MFNIRVYGILINENNQLLVSDEYIRGEYYTKFPGGGLEFGEGTRDCLKREFKEEMDLDVEIGEHIYTTDYFQMSAFNPEHQIISIYYLQKHWKPIKVPHPHRTFRFRRRAAGCISTKPAKLKLSGLSTGIILTRARYTANR